ncbi:hypothetical protein K1719_039368 [Acacia pycnantha]|nr:hypothetical protein K1719_039368 [Acacia pycnantha]
MEGNMSQGGIVPAGASSFGGFDVPTFSHQSQHPQSISHHQTHPHQRNSPIREGFLLSMGTLQNPDQTISVTDFNKGDRTKSSASEEDEPSLTEDGRGKKSSPWHRVKWTDKMVKLLITAVSYLSEDVTTDSGGGGRRKFSVLQKKGKWKCISKVMAERGCHVSPQQCEDKFNDLNKRYKKLNDMLGRGTSCQVVENPALLDDINFLSEKEKDDVRKILSSKQLFYEEMCSYHNCNRRALPHDPALRCSLQIALRNRDDHDNDDVRVSPHDDNDEDDVDLENDDHDDDFEEDYACHGGNGGTDGTFGPAMKKLKQSQDLMFGNPSNSQGYNKSSYPHGMMGQSDVNQVLPESHNTTLLQKQWIESRSIQLEEQKLQLQVEMLELEKQRFKWQRFCKKKDRELEKMRMENERMRLENERIALELKQKKMESGFN